MAYSRSYSGYRYRYRYGTRSSRRWNTGNRKRATGNARAARQQRDAATVTISRIATVPVVIAQGARSAAVPINHWNQLRLSTYFGNYSPMYDQMKIDKIRMKITGNQAGTAQTSNISPAVVLAFDRNGLSEGQQVATATISTYSSSQLKQWSTGNSFVMYQTIYPSTIMEKGQYVPTDSLLDPEETGGDASTNPASDLADPTLPFKPISLLGVDIGSNVATAQTFAFTVEYEYTVTFRGMRKPSLSYSDIDYDTVNIYSSTGGSTEYSLYHSYKFSELNYYPGGTVTYPANSLSIFFTPTSVSFDGDDVILCTIRKQGSESSTVTQNAGYYILTTPSTQGLSLVAAFGHGSDMFVYSSPAPAAQLSVNQYFFDAEDIPLDFNRTN